MQRAIGRLGLLVGDPSRWLRLRLRLVGGELAGWLVGWGACGCWDRRTPRLSQEYEQELARYRQSHQREASVEREPSPGRSGSVHQSPR